jgi:hypothetical protein
MATLKGKLKQILDKHAKELELTGDSLLNLSNLILRFSEADPSKTNKYVGVMTEIFINESWTEEQVIEKVCQFHSVLDKISPKIFEDHDINDLCIPQQIIENPKDIQNYHRHLHLDTVYVCASRYKSKNAKRESIISEQTDIIYDEDDYIIVVPLTFASSCYWGVDTKWCTTMRDDEEYFERYGGESGTLFYVIDKHRKDEIDHPMSKFAFTIPHGRRLEDQGEIFNRPDSTLGNRPDRILPPRIIKRLNEYHINGGLIDLDRIDESFKILCQKTQTIPGDDRWKKTKWSENRMLFASDQFPTYGCEISLTKPKLDGAQEPQLEIFWYKNSNKNKLCIDINIDKLRNLSEIYKYVKKDSSKITIWLNELNRIMNQRYLFAIQQSILKDVIKNEIKTPRNNWRFNLYENPRESQSWREKAKKRRELATKGDSLTDLGNHQFSVSTTKEGLLDKYIVTSCIDFTYNTFILSEGETEKITWEEQFKDFVLLYYTEVGMIGLINDFKSWVIEMITTKSESLMIDLYNDNAAKISSKTNAFDQYLEDPTEKPKKIIKKPKPDIQKIKKKPGLVTQQSKQLGGIKDEVSCGWGEKYETKPDKYEDECEGEWGLWFDEDIVPF